MITRKYIYQFGDSNKDFLLFKNRAGFESVKEAGTKAVYETNSLLDGDIRVKGFDRHKLNPVAYNIKTMFKEETYRFDTLLGFLYSGIQKVFAFSVDRDGVYKIYVNYGEITGNNFPEESVLNDEKFGQDEIQISLQIKMLFPFWYDVTDEITYLSSQTPKLRLNTGWFLDSGYFLNTGGKTFTNISTLDLTKYLTPCFAHLKTHFVDRIIVPEIIQIDEDYTFTTTRYQTQVIELINSNIYSNAFLIEIPSITANSYINIANSNGSNIIITANSDVTQPVIYNSILDKFYDYNANIIDSLTTTYTKEFLKFGYSDTIEPREKETLAIDNQALTTFKLEIFNQTL